MALHEIAEAYLLVRPIKLYALANGIGDVAPIAERAVVDSLIDKIPII
jgi:hypothetical protein